MNNSQYNSKNFHIHAVKQRERERERERGCKINMSLTITIYTNHIGFPWDTLIRKASVVCPDRVLPLLSTIVPDTNTGHLQFSLRNRSSMANSAALELAVSKIVSTKSTSAPPASSPFACSV